VVGAFSFSLTGRFGRDTFRAAAARRGVLDGEVQRALSTSTVGDSTARCCRQPGPAGGGGFLLQFATDHVSAGAESRSSASPKALLIHAKTIVPAPITTQVATVRQSVSFPAKSQMARTDAPTATSRHMLVVQNDSPLTISGLRNPRRRLRGFAS